jgi:hypothetical protein
MKSERVTIVVEGVIIMIMIIIIIIVFTHSLVYFAYVPFVSSLLPFII